MKYILTLIRARNLVMIVLSQALVQACLLAPGVDWAKLLDPGFQVLVLSTVCKIGRAHV